MSINPEASLPPGFRFHPTDEELILHYLKNRVASRPCPVAIIAEVDIYKFNPWDLPAMTNFGDKEWYFFTPRDRKYPNGIRPNRSAASGYWKATGTDRPIVTSSCPGARVVNIGVKKALVFYRGKPPKGIKTGWIMHEYRLAESPSNNNSSNCHLRPMKDKDASMRLDDWVLCRIYEKTSQTTTTQIATELVDEDSNVLDDSYMPTIPSISLQNNYRFPKPPSLSELFQNGEMLSHLLYDNPPETYNRLQGQHGVTQTPYFSNSSSSNCNGISMPMDPIPPQREANDVLMASSLKRHASSGEEGDGSLPLHQSKKCNNTGSTATNFNNQFINTFDQPHVNQNMWSYHLGLH